VHKNNRHLLCCCYIAENKLRYFSVSAPDPDGASYTAVLPHRQVTYFPVLNGEWKQLVFEKRGR
jgi:hypothetical protein